MTRVFLLGLKRSTTFDERITRRLKRTGRMSRNEQSRNEQSRTNNDVLGFID